MRGTRALLVFGLLAGAGAAAFLLVVPRNPGDQGPAPKRTAAPPGGGEADWREPSPGPAAGRPASGIVVGPDGAGVAGATVRAFPASEAQPDSLLGMLFETARPRTAAAEVATGADGRFTLPELPAGGYRFEAEAPCLAASATPWRRIHSEREDPAEPIRIELAEGPPLSGRVADDAGRPVAGAIVAAVLGDKADASRFDAPELLQRSGEDGRFEFPALSPGRVALFVRAEGRPLHFVPVFEHDGPRTLSIVLGGTAAAEIRVTGPNDEPVAGARVFLWVAGDRICAIVDARTGPDGRLRVERLPAGAVDGLAVSASPHADWSTDGPPRRTKPEPLVSGETRIYDVALEPGIVLRGKVMNCDTGKPQSGVVVQPMLMPGQALFPGRGAAISNDLGEYRLVGLAPGRHALLLKAPGYTPVPAPPGGLSGRGLEPPTIQGAEGGMMVWLEGERTEEILHFFLRSVARVRGRVVGPGDRPVAGATVELETDEPFDDTMFEQVGIALPRTTTGADGRFELSGALLDGKLRLVARAEGLGAARSAEIEVRAGDLVEGVELQLAATGALRGTIVGPDGRTVAGAEFRYADLRDDPHDPLGYRLVLANWEPADPEGRFTIENLRPGRWVVEVRAPGCRSRKSAEILVESDRTADAGTLTLARGHRIEGVVVAEDGRPVRGAHLEAKPLPPLAPGASPPPGPLETADDEGRFAFEELEARDYELHAQARGFAPAVLGPAAADGPPVRIVLAAGLAIEGVVIGPDGRPAKDIWVTLTGSVATQGEWTDRRGRFRFDDLPAGEYEIGINHWEGLPAGRSGVLAGTKDLRFELETGLSIEGVVVDPDGEAPPYGFVQAWAKGSNPSAENFGSAPQAIVKENGEFRITGLQPGKYRLLFLAEPVTGGFGELKEVEAGATGIRLQIQRLPK